MRTEEEIIYTLLNTVRAGEFNLDEPLTERLLRSFLKTYRGSRIDKYYSGGQTINDECFQEIFNIPFTTINGNWRTASLPKMISFKNNAGVNFNKYEYAIPVTSSEQWKNNLKGRFTKRQPSIKLVNNQATLYRGLENTTQQLDDNFTNSELNVVVRALNKESLSGVIYLDGKFVLLDPDEDPNYDFTSSPYPFPNEQINALVNSVTARELNIFLKTKSDDIGNKFSNETDNPQTEEF